MTSRLHADAVALTILIPQRCSHPTPAPTDPEGHVRELSSLVLLLARIGAPLSCVPEPLRPALEATRCCARVASSSRRLEPVLPRSRPLSEHIVFVL